LVQVLESFQTANGRARLEVDPAPSELSAPALFGPDGPSTSSEQADHE
jgi:hypothetical protein